MVIANIGEWKVSIMFDIYFKFAELGDHNLGRLFPRLLTNKESLAALQPHFTWGMENQYISEAMNISFKGIISINIEPFQGINIDN